MCAKVQYIACTVQLMTYSIHDRGIIWKEGDGKSPFYSAPSIFAALRNLVREIWFEKYGLRNMVREKWLTRKKGGFIT